MQQVPVYSPEYYEVIDMQQHAHATMRTHTSGTLEHDVTPTEVDGKHHTLL